MPRRTRPLRERSPARADISAEHLATLSHEFRTPLNGVLGMARLLDNTRLTQEQRAYTAALRESGEHLLALVNDVLDFAKLGAGKVELHPAEVDVETLLRGVCELLAPRGREKGLEVAWAAPAAVAGLFGDEYRLRQILLNFIGNAIKFTAQGGVLVRVATSRHGRVRFIVEDTGPGVADEDRGRIFQAFAQSNPAHGSLGGAGLGLAIARELALAMGGDVGVGDSPLGGAQFWFEAQLPIRKAQAAAPLKGRRIGVASASQVVREGARLQIEACGGDAVVADSVAEAERGLGPDDVMLVDFEVAAAGRALRAPPGRPSIILMAPEDRDQIARCRRAGFSGYLITPLRRASLAERVLIASSSPFIPGLTLARHESSGEDDRIAQVAAPGARVLLVEDNAINALLARALLTREGCQVEHATSGTEALAASRTRTHDLILMDMRMPGLSGVETARQLRQDGVETPILALTANAFDEDRQACIAAGMDDFLVKPLSPDALRAALVRWTRTWTDAAHCAKAV